MKINHLADLLLEEFNRYLNGFRPIDRSKTKGRGFVAGMNPTIPESLDWREKGAVTPARYQAQCASCYAFASVAAIESHYFLKSGSLQAISPQNIVDCSKVEPYDNSGCQHGAVDPSFDYVKDNGINSDEVYPYTEKEGECKFRTDESVTRVRDYVVLDEGDEKGLQEAVATKGPVVAGMDASAESFQFYGSGIYYEPKCGNSIDRLNHAVLIVGYTPDYWIIKNSYGVQWGENGYAKISRNVSNQCGIATYALYPVV
ncbi:cathepsin L1-like [Photinus pyralis]|nr:cathepsin L1-like [Photinus pyralis]